MIYNMSKLNSRSMAGSNKTRCKLFGCSVFCAGKAAQQINVPVPEGCTDPNASNFDPTARSDDGTCLYTF